MDIGLPELLVIATVLGVIVVLGLIVVVVVFVLKGAGGKTTKCPRCAERIKAEAKVCRFCRAELSA